MLLPAAILTIVHIEDDLLSFHLYICQFINGSPVVAIEAGGLVARCRELAYDMR
jgi:hypothetical protein